MIKKQVVCITKTGARIVIDNNSDHRNVQLFSSYEVSGDGYVPSSGESSLLPHMQHAARDGKRGCEFCDNKVTSRITRPEDRDKKTVFRQCDCGAVGVPAHKHNEDFFLWYQNLAQASVALGM